MSKWLKINLTNENIETIDLADMEKDYLGGLGVNTRLVFDMIPQGTDPLGPGNVLIFGVGTLVGTLLPCACRTEVTAMSPLNGRFGTANAGGEWGASLKFAGYSGLIITGKAAKPVLLKIVDNHISLEEATFLWGQDVWDTVDQIKQINPEFQVACIGPAGEKKVRYACIQHNYYASWGRTGMGAVMGSKNLKAIAVHGTGAFGVADHLAFNRVMREAFKKIKTDTSFGFTTRYGSMVVSDPYNQMGTLAGHNFTQGSFPTWEATRGRKYFENTYKEKNLACFACPVACAHWSRVKEAGPYQGYETKGLEVTFTLEFGAKLGLESIPEIFKCVELCNRYGLDVISAAGTVAFAIDAHQHGLLSTQKPLRWGDFASIHWLLKKIAFREGIGDLLAEGVKIAAASLPGTAPLAMQIKGVEMPARDPRGKWDVWILGYLTNTRGGDHLRTRSPADMLQGKVINYQEEALEVPVTFIRNLDMPANLKDQIFGITPSKVDIALMAKYAEDLITIINATGLCFM